ncbi:MAG: DUF2214 family protein [Aeromonas sp.]
MRNNALLFMLHYGGIVTLILALWVESLIFRHGLTMMRVRRLLLADGLAALALLCIVTTGGLLALGSVGSLSQLFVDPAYGLKLGLFLSISMSLTYPSRLFYRWRRALRHGRAPMITIQQQFWVIWILRGNLLLLTLSLLLTK